MAARKSSQREDVDMSGRQIPADLPDFGFGLLSVRIFWGYLWRDGDLYVRELG